MHRIHRLKLAGGWLCHLLCLTLDLRVLLMKRLDHVSHLESSVMGASLADYARIQFLSFLY
jgi:hypothetical protein